MKLYVLRHAQAVSNVGNFMDEDPKDNLPLTEEGERQALAMAEELKNISFDALYVSEFQRTKQTAIFVNQHHKLQLIIDERLDEMRSGFNKQPWPQVKKTFESADDRWNARFNDGESFEDQKKRVGSFLEELHQQKYKIVLVVTHGNPIMIMNGLLHNLSNEEMYEKHYPHNAQYMEFEL